MLSLNRRVLIAASAILASFFGIAGATLDQLYRKNSEAALIERLQGHIYILIASSQLDDLDQLHFPNELPDIRFSTVNSGLYAQIVRNDGSWSWRSKSMGERVMPFIQPLARTETKMRRYRDESGARLLLYSYGVAWSDQPQSPLAFTFSVAQDLSGFNADLYEFRKNLWGILAGVAILLLAVQGTILRWGLSPLKHASAELAAIEAGAQQTLRGDYPRELQGLTGNINALLKHQQEHLERYRNSLGDLAHSLKTPLAILQNATENGTDSVTLAPVVREQVERMNQITGYQLQRAATSGWTTLAAPVNIKAIIDKVVGGLAKVYAEKRLQVSCEVDESLEFHGDEGDLYEIIGNLLDNAFKWGRQRVAVVARSQPGATPDQQVLFLSVEDDGPGVSPDQARDVIQRGFRADQTIAGHGIGLSIVKDIVQVYGGEVEIAVATLGGAAVKLRLPMRRARR